jgi:SNF2 family DNA or RNA helicase
MMKIYAELHTTPTGDEERRITLHGYTLEGQLDETPFNDNFLIKEIPGKRWEPSIKRWTLPLSFGACLVLRAQFGDRLLVGPGLQGWAESQRYRRNRALELREALTPPDDYQHVNDHDEVLFPFQIPGAEFLVTARNALLGDEMGTGKTFQTIAGVRRVDMIPQEVGGSGYPVIIVCPNTLKRNWEREVKRWLPEATPFVIHGSIDKRRKQLAEAAEASKAVVIMNFEAVKLHSRLSAYGSTRLKRCTECDPKTGTEGMKAAACEMHPKELNAIPFKVAVCDEAHRVKDPNAQQSRALWHVFHAPSVQYRWALTGTPLANHPGDLWSIAHMLDPETFPAKTAFLDRYALKRFNAFGGMEVMGLNPERKAEFFQIFDPMFRRMIKAQVLPQLPSKVYQRRDVEMTPKQAKAYKEIAEQLVTVLDDGTVMVADGNLVAATRLLQFSSAMCKVDKGETPDDPITWRVNLIDYPKSPKIDELMRIIEDHPDKPLAIAAEHRQLLMLAGQRLTAAGIPFAEISGAVTADERDAAVQAFQSGRLNYILFTYKAGGVGLNLTRADTLVRLQRNWSLVEQKQAEDRVHRIGSEEHQSVTIIDLVTAGTIEETQIERLYAKAERLEEIVRDREKLRSLGEPVDELDAEAARIEATGLMGG